MILVRIVLIVTVMCAVGITFTLTSFDTAPNYNNLMTIDWSTHVVDVGSTALQRTESNANLTNTITMLQDKVAVLEQQLLRTTQGLNDVVEAASKLAEKTTETTTTTTETSERNEEKEHSSSAVLPTCDDLMNRYDIYRDGSFLTRPTTEVLWTMRVDGSRELTFPHHCRLKRYNATEAQQCLTGHHMAFVGDSLSRYQYLSLVHLIEKNKYPARFARRDEKGKCTHLNEKGETQCTMHGEKNVCFEGTYRDWQSFYVDLGGGEDGGMFNGRMQCSCAQLDMDKTDGTPEDSYTQSMHYVSDVQNDMGERIKMTMFNEVGWFDEPSPLNGFNFKNCSYDGSCRHSVEYNNGLIARAYNKSWDWSAPLKEALTTTLLEKFGDVDITMYNRGLWNQLKAAQLNQLMPLFYEWSGGEQGRCFYRSTTASTRTRLKGHMLAETERNRLFDETVKAGCAYWDVAHITREFIEYVQENPGDKKISGREKKVGNWDGYNALYWDAVHYSPWVYEELNNLFLNILCNVEDPA